MSEWVVRAGIAFWRDLQKAYRRDGTVYGFSVQYAANVPWQELAKAGNFPHANISYADRLDLENSVSVLGYELHLFSTPGRGYHHELSLSVSQNGIMLTQLPDAAAQALSYIFQQNTVPNPFPAQP